MQDEESGRADSALEQRLAWSEEPREPHIPNLDVLSILAFVFAVIVVIGMVVLRPTGSAREHAEELTALGVPTQFHEAEVVSVDEGPCVEGSEEACQEVAFRLLAGPDIGFVYR